MLYNINRGPNAAAKSPADFVLTVDDPAARKRAELQKFVSRLRAVAKPKARK